MQIEGEIESIIYRNDTNGYTIAKLIHNNEPTIIVGKIYDIKIGENIRLNGIFNTNPQYGEQFVFDKFEIIYPNTTNGIKKFLESGLIKGVGPKIACAIVEKFGKETLDIIEYKHKDLTCITGVSLNKAKSIYESFYKYKNVHNVIVFLSEYNLSVNLILKIYEIYKDDTIKIIQENPYSLVENIDGIGFSTADKIANNIGIDKDSEFRIRAGILYCLTEASEKNGHTYLPYDYLLKSLAKLLNLNEKNYLELFHSVVQTLCLEKVIIKFFKDFQNIVMLNKFHFYEKSIAEKLALLNISSNNAFYDIKNEIKLFEDINSIKFHNEQILAIENAVNNGVCVITGGPGTGKTTIIKCIISILEAQGKKTALLAPTGRASKRMCETTGKDASTIHRALSYDFITKNFFYNNKNPLPFDAVIVDEFSMVDVMLAFNFLRSLNRDCKLIIVGDKDQLSSVGAGNVLDDIIKSETISTTNLTQIFRQDENSLIISNAHKINAGLMPEFDNKSADFFFESIENLEEIKNNIVNLVTKRLPKFLDLSPTSIQVLAPMKNGICGIENINKELQHNINPPSINKPEIVIGNSILRQGDKVMQTVNNYNIEWTKNYDNNRIEQGVGVFNGDIGFIDSIDRNTGEVYVRFENDRQTVYPRGEIAQLSLAYAITIHKSQGSEFDAVIIPSISGPSIILNRNLIYTAVTRAKKIVVLVGEKRNLKRMITNKFILKRFTMLKDFLVDSDKRAKILFE